MLATQIGAATGALVPPELQFIYPLLSGSIGSNDDTVEFDYVLREIEDHYSFRILGLQMEALEFARCHFADSKEKGALSFINSVIMAFASQNGLNAPPAAVIEHSPVGRRYVDLLCRHFDQVRFIGILRDPRAVYASLKRLPWGPQTAAYFCIWWKSALLETLHAKAAFSDRVRLVSYEDFIADNEVQTQQAVEFFGLSGLQGQRGASTLLAKTTYNAKQHALVGGGIDKSRLTAWSEILTSSEVATIEYHCREQMRMLGYELSGRGSYSAIRYYLGLAWEKPMYKIGALRQKYRRQLPNPAMKPRVTQASQL
jgi:hypothetical protein